ncbi:MAG: Ig domain-containing protein [Terriglobales bacterium]
MNRRLAVAFILLLALLLAACGGGGGSNNLFNPAPPQPLAIATKSLPDGAVAQDYSATIVVTGGSGQYTVTISSGALAPGLSFNSTTRTISGRPAVGGLFNFTVRAQDTQNTAAVVQRDFTMHIVGLHVVPTSLPAAAVNQPYSVTLQAVENNGPPAWTSSALPPGLQFNVSADPTRAVISGTPTQLGNYDVSVTVTDAVVSITLNLTFSITSGIVIGPDVLPAADFGQVYSQQLQISGGTPPYGISVIQIPDGLTLSNSGLLTGIVAVQTGAILSIEVIDSLQLSQTKWWSLTVNPPPFAIITDLPPARTDSNYEVTLLAAGAYGGVTWWGTNLPSGMALGATTGLLRWPSAVAGTYNFTVHASTTTGQTADRNYTFVVQSASGRNDSIATATPLGRGRYRASVSPFADANGNAAPDLDYYRIDTVGGATLWFETYAARLTDVTSELDTVIELLDANGNRLTTCKDPGDNFDYGRPIITDSTPDAYDDPCIDDDATYGSTDSQLSLRVPGTLGQPATIYLRIFDWRGDARPDLLYDLFLSGTN